MNLEQVNKTLAQLAFVSSQKPKIEQLIALALEEHGDIFLSPPKITASWSDWSKYLRIEINGKGDYEKILSIPEGAVVSTDAVAAVFSGFRACGGKIVLSVIATNVLSEEDKETLRMIGKIRMHTESTSHTDTREILACGMDF